MNSREPANTAPVLIALIVAVAIIIVAVTSLLKGADLFRTNTSNDPQTCQERVAFQLADNYPDPNNLTIAVNMICEGNVTTTTRPP